MKKLLLCTILCTIAIILLSSSAWAYCGVKPIKPARICSGDLVLVCEQTNGWEEQYRWICVR